MHGREANLSTAALEERSRQLFLESVDAVDMRVRSRLTQARHAALEAASVRASWLPTWRVWIPASGATAAVLIAAALWLGSPRGMHHATADAMPNLEDLDIVATTDANAGDPMEMLQNDLDFYDFADKAASEPTA